MGFRAQYALARARKGFRQSGGSGGPRQALRTTGIIEETPADIVEWSSRRSGRHAAGVCSHRPSGPSLSIGAAIGRSIQFRMPNLASWRAGQRTVWYLDCELAQPYAGIAPAREPLSRPAPTQLPRMTLAPSMSGMPNRSNVRLMANGQQLRPASRARAYWARN